MKCEFFKIDMYEPYLNREKQYLKMNAELDNRFKEIDPMKSDSADVVKPRLNVFGNSSKVNSPTKLVPQKPKRSEVKGGTTPKSVGEMLNNLSDTSRSLKNTNTFHDKPQKLKFGATSSRFNHQGNLSERKSSDKDYSAVEVHQSTNEKSTAATVSTTTNDVTAKKNISSEGLIKFLKSKVAILKQELDQIQQESVKNLRAYEGSVDSNKKNATQIEQLTNENEALKIQIEKLHQANVSHETAIKEKDLDMAILNKEIVMLKKQLKEVNRLHNVLDKRFLKSQDDLEHLKKNLNNSQECERQQRAVNRQQKSFFEDQIKIMSKQRTGLISAYKKQLLLLDNLKRQNLCLEQSKLLQVAEKDFMKILDWNSH